MEMEKFKMYIDGEFVEAASGEWFDSFDPIQTKKKTLQTDRIP